MNFLITGATGLIGRRLVPFLTSSGHQIVVLSRRPSVAAQLGDGLRIVGSLDELPKDTPVDVVVHLAGEPVAGKLWTAKRKQYLRSSRAELPAQIGKWIAAANTKPAVWLNASAIGFYGTPQNPDRVFTETDATGEGFAAQLCSHIESSAEAACAVADSQTRLVNLRIGLVLARVEEGGYLGKLAMPIKFWLGTILGNGQNWQSWIHITDVVQAIDHCARAPDLVGPVNLTAPNPERAETLMLKLGKVLNRPIFFRMPAFALRWIARDMADDLLLASQRVEPQRLLESGYEFSHPDLSDALLDLLVSGRKT